VELLEASKAHDEDNQIQSEIGRTVDRLQLGTIGQKVLVRDLR
jgi:hypothetical protein